MQEETLFLIAAIVLIAAFLAGMRRWNGEATSDGSLRSIFGRSAIVLATVGGLIGAPFWWLDVEPSFAWDLPPLAARLLAVAAFAFGLCGLVVLEWPSPRRTRLYLSMVAAYLVPLLTVAVLFDLDRFDFGRAVTWGFFAATIILSALAVGELLRAMATHPGLPSARFGGTLMPMWLVLVGLAMAGWSLALFVAPDTLFPAVFVWRQDPLSSRLVAAMLLTIGVAALQSTNDIGSGRLALLFHGIYGLGVIAALSVDALQGEAVRLLYGIGLGGAGLVSLTLLAMLGTERSTDIHPRTRLR